MAAFNNEVFPLNVKDTITVTPLELTVGYRFRWQGFVPYAGGGIGWHRFEETSEHSADQEDVKKTYTGYHVAGGVERPIRRWLGAAVDAQWAAVPNALGDAATSVAKVYGEHNLAKDGPDAPLKPGWGHASSRDLVHWEHAPIALMPVPGTYDAEAVASGCCSPGARRDAVAVRAAPLRPVLREGAGGVQARGGGDECGDGGGSCGSAHAELRSGRNGLTASGGTRRLRPCPALRSSAASMPRPVAGRRS